MNNLVNDLSWPTALAWLMVALLALGIAAEIRLYLKRPRNRRRGLPAPVPDSRNWLQHDRELMNRWAKR